MCVIIHLPAGKTLSKKLLQNCYDNNSHGYGILWRTEEGKLEHVKSIKDFDDFLKNWKDVPRNVERSVHFRIKTHGLINEENCHPFFPRVDLGLMHNGMIQTIMKDENMSDTYNFAEHELKHIVAKWDGCLENQHEAFIRIVSRMTEGSKLLFMDSKGNVKITFPEKWHKQDGCAFSNKHSLDARTCSTSYSGNYGGSRNWDGWAQGKVWDTKERKYVWPAELNDSVDDVGNEQVAAYLEAKDRQDEQDAAEQTQEQDFAAAADAANENIEDDDEIVEEFLDATALYSMTPAEILEWTELNPLAATASLFELMGREKELIQLDGGANQKKLTS